MRGPSVRSLGPAQPTVSAQQGEDSHFHRDCPLSHALSFLVLTQGGWPCSVQGADAALGLRRPAEAPADPPSFPCTCSLAGATAHSLVGREHHLWDISPEGREVTCQCPVGKPLLLGPYWQQWVPNWSSLNVGLWPGDLSWPNRGLGSSLPSWVQVEWSGPWGVGSEPQGWVLSLTIMTGFPRGTGTPCPFTFPLDSWAAENRGRGTPPPAPASAPLSSGAGSEDGEDV